MDWRKELEKRGIKSRKQQKQKVIQQSIIIDTDYFLKTGIKRELIQKKTIVKKPVKKRIRKIKNVMGSEEQREAQRIYKREYVKKNREKVKQYKEEYRKKNMQKIRDYKKRYYHENKEAQQKKAREAYYRDHGKNMEAHRKNRKPRNKGALYIENVRQKSRYKYNKVIYELNKKFNIKCCHPTMRRNVYYYKRKLLRELKSTF